PNHVSSVLPKALVSRIAISGLMPDLPLTMLLRVCRVTPRIFAPAVTDRPSGSRQALRTMRPGCAGFFMGMSRFLLRFLVVIDQLQRQMRRHLQYETQYASWPALSQTKTPSNHLSAGEDDNRED